MMNKNEIKHKERLLELIRFYRKNPVLAAEDLLRVKLAVPQQKVLEDMWFKNFILVTAGRGTGKTFINSVFACLWAMLFPGQKVGLLAPSFRQAKLLFQEVESRWNQAPILQESTANKPITASDRCYLPFRNSGFGRPSLIEAVPLGDGCLAGQTFVTSDKGIHTFNTLVPVIDFLEDEQVFKADTSIWGHGGFKTSDEKYYNGIRDTIVINTSSGRSVEGTANHKFKVLRNGSVSWERFDSLNEDDYLLLDLSPRWHLGTIKESEAEAYAAGLLTGDGCWSNKYRISFATKDGELVEALKLVFDNIYLTSDGCHYYIDGIKTRQRWLDKWEISWIYSTEKRFPSKILCGEKSKAAAFIRGLFDTDGHVQVSEGKGGVAITVGFTNTSETLIDELQYVLTHFGINSHKYYRDRNTKWSRCFELLITGKDVVTFNDNIGFGLKRKSSLLSDSILRKTRFINSGDFVPGVKDECLRVRSLINIDYTSLSKEEKSLLRPSALVSMSHISRTRINLLLKAASECCVTTDLYKLSNDNIRFDKISSIDCGRSPTYDIHIPEHHHYVASGYISHNSKIRGARYYAIIADEFAQIPKEIFNTVILPMGATVADPMANVQRLAQQKDLIRRGLADSSDFTDSKDNKVIMTSSAFYQFNHMYQTKLEYEEAIRKGEPQYSVHTISFRDMPEGFLSEQNIKNSKAVLSSIEFRMEYEAIWEADSAGVFKASLIEKCRSRSEHTVLLKGKPGCDYVLGVDPARASDAFALCLIELGQPNKLVGAWEFYQNVFPKMAQTIVDIADSFNVVAIHMDAGAGGGGLAMKDLLAEEERWGASHRILDADDEDLKDLSGRHILHLFNPSPKTNAEAVYASLNLLEKGALNLPKRPQPTGSSEDIFKQLDDLEEVYDTVDRLLRQLMLIEVTESKSGVAHFDVPSGGGHAAQKKDLFTSFILASKKTYDMQLSNEDDGDMLQIGIIEKRPEQLNSISRSDSDFMGVSQIPVNSWAIKKTFKPG